MLEYMSIDIGKHNEFYSHKPKTIFCDIDGTILKHAHRFSELDNFSPIALSGVVDKFNEWDSLGHKIILVTARKESGREMTERHLKSLGLMWDHLIMGVSSGQRILINDKLKSQDPDRAKAVNVITDSGFISVDWEDFGL
jgi:hydroxymethylpyrimidine pyrophosphatase-like HAD family hydrolase